MANSIIEQVAPELLTAEQAARILGLKPQTLANWRTGHRMDVPFIRIGRTIRYPASEIRRIAVEGLQKSERAA